MIILQFLIITFFVSCEEIGKMVEEKETTVDTEFYEMDFVVEETDRNGFHIFSEEFFSNNISSLLSTMGLTEDKVEAVIIKEAQVSLIEAQNYEDFRIMRFIELTVYTDSLGDTKIAWSDPIPKDQSTVSLDLSDENILPYFREDNFILTAQGYLEQRIYGDMKLHAKVKFMVRAKP